MNMECFSICLCPLLFTWAVVCSSPWRCPSHSFKFNLIPLTNKIPRHFILLKQLWMGVHSLFGSLVVCYWCIGMLVISAHWFCILKLSWSCLSVPEDFGLRWWGLLNIWLCCLQIETIWLHLFQIEYALFVLFLA